PPGSWDESPPGPGRLLTIRRGSPAVELSDDGGGLLMFSRATGIPLAVVFRFRPAESGRRSTPQRSCDMRIWVKLAILAVVLAVGGGLRAQERSRTDDKPTRTDDKSADEKKFNDTHFVDHAYTAGQNAMILNQMALQRSRNEDVRRFAQKMLED